MEGRLKGKKIKEKGSVQGLKYCVQGFQICNVERSLKGKKKKKTKTKTKQNVEAFSIAWENREFESYPPSCSTVSQ